MPTARNYLWPALLASLPGLLLPAASFAAGSWVLASSTQELEDSASAGVGLDKENSLDEELYLEVVLNGENNRQLARFIRRDEKFFASAATLRTLGLRWPGSESAQGLQDLSQWPALRLHYDAGLQRMILTAPVDMLERSTTLNERRDSPQADPVLRQPGAVLNYDLYGQRSDVASQFSAYSELRLFGLGPGLWSNSLLNRYSSSDIAGSSTETENLRLDTSWRWDQPESMTSLVVGDTLTGSLSWSRSTRIGGLHFGRDFSLQPYRSTAPLAVFTGEAALPSTVDLYINGLRQLSQPVPPGQFVLNTVPTTTGQGQALMVVTDMTGQSQTLALPFYGTPDLLQTGLSDWSLDLGFVRQNYGLRSFDYAERPMASASGRYGWNNALTLEGHGEFGEGLQMAGAGGLWRLGETAGVLSSNLAASHADNDFVSDSGQQLGLAYRWSRRDLSLGVSTEQRSEGFRDVASLNGSLLSKSSFATYAGINDDALGSFGMGVVSQAYFDADSSRYFTVNWSRQLLWSASVNFSLVHDLKETGRDSAFLSLTLPLDRYRRVGASLRQSNGESRLTLEASQTAPYDRGGWGWRAETTPGSNYRNQAEINQLGRYGQWAAGVYGSSAGNSGYASANGAVSFLPQGVHAMRQVSDAFAVISTDGVPDVPVRLENRIVGKTDADGLLFVRDLNSYQRNQLSIDTLTLPGDLAIETTRVDAVPEARSAVLAHFPMRRIQILELNLKDARGQWLPAGSPVWLGHETPASNTEPVTVVGHDGFVYLENPPERTTLWVSLPTGRCRVVLPALPAAGPINLPAQTCY